MENKNFCEHLVKLQPELLSFALKLTADKEDANDLLQATALKALDNEFKFIPETNFRGWIYTIMRNLFINNYRKVLRDQTYVDKSENIYQLATLIETGEEILESTYDLREMYKIVNSLPKDFSVPFSMYVSGFKYREISEKLNLPIGTVKSRIFMTRQKLQCIFQDFK